MNIEEIALNTKSLRMQIVDMIRLQIISGQLRPGERIQERELSKQLNISVTPVKEAFRFLESTGLLVTLPRKYTMVSEFAKQNLEQVSILRSALEGVSANLATKNMTDENYRYLKNTLYEAETLLKDSDKLVDTVESIYKRFHEEIHALSKNQFLCQLIENQKVFSQGFRYETLKSIEDRKVSHCEHLAILEAMHAGKNELAEELMRNHIRNSDTIALKNIIVVETK